MSILVVEQGLFDYQIKGYKKLRPLHPELPQLQRLLPLLKLGQNPPPLPAKKSTNLPGIKSFILSSILFSFVQLAMLAAVNNSLDLCLFSSQRSEPSPYGALTALFSKPLKLNPH